MAQCQEASGIHPGFRWNVDVYSFTAGPLVISMGRSSLTGLDWGGWRAEQHGWHPG